MDGLISQNTGVALGTVIVIVSAIIAGIASLFRVIAKSQQAESKASASVNSMEQRMARLEAQVTAMDRDVMAQRESNAVMRVEIQNVKAVLERIDKKFDSILEERIKNTM